MKFGVDITRVRQNYNFDFFNNGSFDFTFGDFTGDQLADFVGGFWDNYFQFSNAVYGIRTGSFGGYAQDTWRVRPRLTLSYGLRYEYYLPQSDVHNNILGFFPGQQSTRFPDAPSGILYPGDPGSPNKALVYPDYNNFAPRFGFAWDMFGNAKLVMRGGFGIFYDIEDGALNLQFGGQPPFGAVSNFFPVRLHRHHWRLRQRSIYALRLGKSVSVRLRREGRHVRNSETSVCLHHVSAFPDALFPELQLRLSVAGHARHDGGGGVRREPGKEADLPGRNELSRPSDPAATTQPVWIRESRLRSAADRNRSGYCAVHGRSFADRPERHGHWRNPAIH